jgi:hypothetical protein
MIAPNNLVQPHPDFDTLLDQQLSGQVPWGADALQAPGIDTAPAKQPEYEFTDPNDPQGQTVKYHNGTGTSLSTAHVKPVAETASTGTSEIVSPRLERTESRWDRFKRCAAYFGHVVLHSLSE